MFLKVQSICDVAVNLICRNWDEVVMRIISCSDPAKHVVIRDVVLVGDAENLSACGGLLRASNIHVRRPTCAATKSDMTGRVVVWSYLR